MKNKKDITQKLSKLPIHEAPTQSWRGIESTLNFDKKLVSAIPNLPSHKAPNSIWNAIVDDLESHKTHHIPTWITIAASFIILLSIPFLLRYEFSAHKTSIHIAEEITMDHQAIQQKQQTELNLTAYCEQFPTVCSSNKYNGLQNQLNRLKLHKEQLKEMKNFDSDPDIDTYIQRIDLETATIQRQIIALF